MRRAAWIMAGVMLAGCPRLVLPPGPSTAEADPCAGSRRTDVFDVAGRNKLDILMVVDTSPVMEEARDAAADRLETVGLQLAKLAAGANFHLGVAATNQGGVLRRVKPAANGPGQMCTGLTTEMVPEDCPTCARYLTSQDCNCPVPRNCDPQSPTCGDRGRCLNLLLQLRDLVSVPLDPMDIGRRYSAAATVRSVLGLSSLRGDSRPSVEPPLQNAGFYRDDARLVIFLVTQGEDPLLDDDPGDGDYERLLRQLRTLKGPGRERDVIVATISPMHPPTVLQNVPGIGNVAQACGQLRSNASNALTCSSSLRDVDGIPEVGCCAFGRDAGACPTLSLKSSRSLLALACDTGGVFYNLCANDWSSVVTGDIEALFAPPSNLRLPLAEPVKDAAPCGDGTGLCVDAISSTGQRTRLTGGYSLEGNQTLKVDPSNLGIGARLVVSYDVTTPTTQCCDQAGGCGDLNCNDEGFCQEESCRLAVSGGPTTTCPEGTTQCDVVTGRCVPLGRCTKPEHCPMGMDCDCEAQQCFIPDAGVR